MPPREQEQVTVGPEKISLSIVRKTKGDLIVSQYAIERWFGTPDEAYHALRGIMDTVSKWPGDGDDPLSD